MAEKTYVIIVQVDDEHQTVTALLKATHIRRGNQSYQTAWSADSDEAVLDPQDGHEIMTYDDRDSAIGELMTSVRDNFDNDSKYR